MNSVRGKGKRGFSSIVGAVFMVLIMMVLASSYFVYTLAQNTAYNAAVEQKNQLEQSVRSENLECINTTYTAFSDTNVNIDFAVRNIGSTSVQFITIWISVSNPYSDWIGYNFKNLTKPVQPGSVYADRVNLTVAGLNSTFVNSYASWLVTSKGNTVVLQTRIMASNIIIAQTTQGIGALMMDFENFTYYRVKQSGSSWYLDFSTATSAYNVKMSDAPIAFSVRFTDLDLRGRDINLSLYSELFSIFPSTGGNYKAATWYIVNVDSTTGVLSAPFHGQTLTFNVATAVYFACIGPVNYASYTTNSFVKSTDMFLGTCPINLALVGTVGGQPFGQNIPFVSAYVY